MILEAAGDDMVGLYVCQLHLRELASGWSWRLSAAGAYGWSIEGAFKKYASAAGARQCARRFAKLLGGMILGTYAQPKSGDGRYWTLDLGRGRVARRDVLAKCFREDAIDADTDSG